MLTHRRRFLQSALGTSAVLAIGGGVPEFLRRAAQAGMHAGGGERILVVIQLSGGNDGLNTVIPVKAPEYQSARPTLAVAVRDALMLNDELGLHPAARGLADLWEQSQLAVVQGVGYPNPNRSHFESMDIWHTCQRDKQQRQSGWLGRYLAASRPGGSGDVAALHLGPEKQPLALRSRSLQVPSIRSLERFRLGVSTEEAAAAIGNLAEMTREGESDDLLGFVSSSTRTALDASQRVMEAAEAYRTGVTYPETQLAGKLRVAAQLIDAQLATRVFYVTLDGFDTHSQQAGAHAALLRQLGDALATFCRDLQEHGHLDRTLVMVFSEFGRRVAENASEGTDHGAAAPMFLAGGPVAGGLVGAHPSLSDLEQGDLKFHTDFRQVYATVLEKWLECESAAILGERFELLSGCVSV